MGLFDDLKKWAHPYEDEDEEYEDDFPTSAPATPVPLRTSVRAAASATARRIAAIRS